MSSRRNHPSDDDVKVLSGADLGAVLLDLDGVVTDTASLHARAWKETFDPFLSSREGGPDENLSPFDISTDYTRHVDGKPREAGIRDFLEARGIALPEGDADGSDPATVAGLARDKNEAFHRLMEEEGVRVYPDALAFLARTRDAGLRLAMVTSSRNGTAILKAAGLEQSFEATADGNDLAEHRLSGKPAPDLFLLGARRLGEDPGRCAVIEDALAGVEAGRAGGFAKVIGVARRDAGAKDELLRAGADVAVESLDALRILSAGEARSAVLPGALAALPEIKARAKGKRLAVFLDYDGTLTPIVDRPEWATLSTDMRQALESLASVATVAVVSGRDRADVERLVGLPQVYYAGSHGFDIGGPGGMRMRHEGGTAAQPALRDAEQNLRAALAVVEGVLIEPKGFALAVHFRLVGESDLPKVEHAVREVADSHPELRRTGGKKIFELRPDIDWDKGRAVLWVLEALGLEGEDTLTIYLGDDETDEDAFRALRNRGIGIFVGEPGADTRADYVLPDTSTVGDFLRALADETEKHGGRKSA